MVGESLASLLLEAQEINHHVGLVIAHCNGDITLVYYAEGHGSIGRSRPYLLDIGDTQDDEHPSIVIFITCTLVGIAHVGEKIVGDIKLLFEQFLIFVCWTGDLYPTVGLPLVYHLQPTGSIPICSHCTNPVLKIIIPGTRIGLLCHPHANS